MCIVVAQDLLQLCCARLKKKPLWTSWALGCCVGFRALGLWLPGCIRLAFFELWAFGQVLAFSVLGHYSFKVQARTSVFLEIAL